MNAEKLENFTQAFADRGRCRDTCECGKQFFNAADDSIDWEEGELEELEKSATGLDHSVGVFELQGKRYVDSCTCWHGHVGKFLALIDGNASRIADYLTLEKKRKQRIADRAPVVG